MKASTRNTIVIAFGLVMMTVTAAARELGAREARQKIADAVGIDKLDRVHIKSISSGPGGDAIVEATLDAAFVFTKDAGGNWLAKEVRTGDRRWESIELIQTAIRKEKVLRTTADLRTLAGALASFKRDRGFYVVAESGSGLIDNLSPQYLPLIIRLDAWSNEFEYSGSATGYRLSSRGPDGKSGTDDDIVIQNGAIIGGA